MGEQYQRTRGRVQKSMPMKTREEKKSTLLRNYAPLLTSSIWMKILQSLEKCHSLKMRFKNRMGLIWLQAAISGSIRKFKKRQPT